MSEEKEAHQTFLFNTIIIVPLIKIMSSEAKCGVFDVDLFLLGIILGLNFDLRLNISFELDTLVRGLFLFPIKVISIGDYRRIQNTI
jgi:hypothetical protein